MNRIKNTFGTPNVANPGYVCLLPGLVTAFETFGRSFYPFLVWNDTKRMVNEAEFIPGGDPNNPVVWDRSTDTAKGINNEGLRPAILGSYQINQREVKPAFQLLRNIRSF